MVELTLDTTLKARNVAEPEVIKLSLPWPSKDRKWKTKHRPILP